MKRPGIVLLACAAILLASAGIVPASLAQNKVRPAPTAADWAALAKLPDFSGVWEQGGGGGARGGAGGAPGAGGARGAGGAPAARGAGAPAAAPGARGAGAPRGGGGMQLTPEYAAMRDAIRAKGAEDAQTANCLPAGMPAIMGQPYPMEFLLTPGKVTIVIEAYTQVRHIYTDGRTLPEDPDLTFDGTSVGRWEGNTLVVESVGFSSLTPLDRGVPHSDQMKIVERFQLTDPDTMSIETTITDPKALLAPYTTTRTLRRHRDWTIAEYICEENNKNFVDEKGKAGIRLDEPAAIKK
jgi:hypothetical protein